MAGGLILAGFIVAAIPVPAAAEMLGNAQQITVHATVEPARIIVVAADNPGTIIDVFSNTSQPVPPHVYVQSTAGRQLPLSLSLQAAYTRLVAAHPGFGVGEIRASYAAPAHRISAAKPGQRLAVPRQLLAKYEFAECITNRLNRTLQRAGSPPCVHDAGSAKANGVF